MCRKSSGRLCYTKKSVALFRLHWFSEVFDYLIHPITTYKPTPVGGNTQLLFWMDFLEVVEVSENQISYFAFFYSMVCITGYAVFLIGDIFVTILISLKMNLQKYIFIFAVSCFLPKIRSGSSQGFQHWRTLSCHG